MGNDLGGICSVCEQYEYVLNRHGVCPLCDEDFITEFDEEGLEVGDEYIDD